MERSQVAPLLKETPLSHRPAQEHLAARVACALLPTRLAAYGCPGSPSHTPCKELLSQCPHPQGSQLSGHLDAILGSPGCLSGFPLEKQHWALGRAQPSQPQRAGSQESHQHRVDNQ